MRLGATDRYGHRNAGISGGTGGDGESDAKTRAIFEVNVAGTLNTIQPVIPLMKQRGRGANRHHEFTGQFSRLSRRACLLREQAAVRIYGEALRGETRATLHCR